MNFYKIYIRKIMKEDLIGEILLGYGVNFSFWFLLCFYSIFIFLVVEVSGLFS